MTRPFALLLAVASVGAALTHQSSARACGGCFHEPPGPQDVGVDTTVVNEHHMAFSVGKTRTILWDQIKYSGNPKQFAWVLPVRPGTTIELSNDTWMKALDAFSAPVVLPPVIQYKAERQPAFSFQCGSSDSATFADNAGAGAPPVTVVSDVVVGPYEAVTLRSADPTALNTWLASHNYEVPKGFQTTIDAYVKEQFDFIALRLLPGANVQSMRPVRIITQGTDATLPLRMVAAGTGANVSVVLYVIGEGRYHTSTFPDAVVDDSKLVWNYAAYSSNYATLADEAMKGGGKPAVLTEYAVHANAPEFSNSYPTLLYANQQAAQYAQSQGDSCPILPDGGAVDASLPDGGAPDASFPSSDAGLPTGPCTYDDYTVATDGMRASDVWVTRLRMELPQSALSEDLVLAAAPQTAVSNLHQTPTPPTASADGGCATTSTRSNDWTALAFGAFAAVWIVRRRRRNG